MARLIHELISGAAQRTPAALALRHEGASLAYAELARQVAAFGAGLAACGAARRERVALWLPPGVQAVVALFGSCAAQCTAVPLAHDATAAQAAADMRRAGANILVTTRANLAALEPELQKPGMPHTVVVSDGAMAPPPGLRAIGWDDCQAQAARTGLVQPDTDAALLLPGEAGDVAYSHRELLAAAHGAVRCLGMCACDRLLAALPPYADHGLLQLLTVYSAGAAAIVAAGADPEQLVRLAALAKATRLAALPALWPRLAGHDWSAAGDTLRYLTVCGGELPRAPLDALRRALPRARVHLAYGIAQVHRSTCLAPMPRRPAMHEPVRAPANVIALKREEATCPPFLAGAHS